MIKRQKQPHFSKDKEHGVTQCRLKTVNVTSAPARGGPLPLLRQLRTPRENSGGLEKQRVPSAGKVLSSIWNEEGSIIKLHVIFVCKRLVMPV